MKGEKESLESRNFATKVDKETASFDIAHCTEASWYSQVATKRQTRNVSKVNHVEKALNRESLTFECQRRALAIAEEKVKHSSFPFSSSDRYYYTSFLQSTTPLCPCFISSLKVNPFSFVLLTKLEIQF